MRTDFNVMNTQQQQRPSFKAIDYKAAEDTLRKVLSSKELVEFKNIVSEQKNNPHVNLNLFGNGKKLDANLFDGEMLHGTESRFRHYNQHFWESPMGFIHRMIKKIEKRTPEVQELVEKQNFEF